LLLTFRQNHQRRARWSHPLHAGSKPDLGLPWKTQRDAPPEPQHSPRSKISHRSLTLTRSVSDVLTAPDVLTTPHPLDCIRFFPLPSPRSRFLLQFPPRILLATSLPASSSLRFLFSSSSSPSSPAFSSPASSSICSCSSLPF